MGDLERIKLMPSTDNVAEGLRAFLTAHGGVLIDDVPSDGLRPSELVWKLSENAELIYVQDPYLNASYLVLTGENVVPLAEEIHQLIPSWTIDRIIQRWDRERDGDPGTASQLALALGLLGPSKADPDLIARLQYALDHRSPEVRQNAVFASSVLGWPELRPHLEERRRKELHPDIQAALDLALGGAS